MMLLEETREEVDTHSCRLMWETELLSVQTGFENAQAFSISELSKGRGAESVPAKELYDTAMVRYRSSQS